MKVNELISSILDLSKTVTTDDSYLTEELVLFLCKKYRSFLVRKEREKEASASEEADEFEYQQLCLDMEVVSGGYCGDKYLRTVNKLPKIVEGTEPKVFTNDYYQSDNISFVSKERMRHVGSNPYLKNIIYASIGADQHLYLKSSNPQFLFLKKVRVSGVFADFDEVAEYLCDNEGNATPCDVMEEEFPIRDYLVPMLIELVVKELVGSAFRPKDSINNAADDLSDLIAWARKNMKSDYLKQLEGQ